MAARRKRPHLLRTLFDDHFLLELIWCLNAVHFIFMVIYTAVMCRDYRYFGLHFISTQGFWNFVSYLVQFLAPTLLAFLFAFLLNCLDHTPRLLQNIASGLCGILLVLAVFRAIALTPAFKPSMPFASYTTRVSNIGQYDEYVLHNPPTQGCPNLAFSLPESAQDVNFSYWYVHTYDYEWQIQVSYTLPEADYTALREEMLDKFNNMKGIQSWQTDDWNYLSTGSYLEGYGRAYTKVDFSYSDSACRISYALACFYYEMH